MGSVSIKFDAESGWIPLAGPAVDGESTVEEAQRLMHLREAKQREAIKFRCPVCGELGALIPPNDRYHQCPGPRDGAA